MANNNKNILDSNDDTTDNETMQRVLDEEREKYLAHMERHITRIKSKVGCDSDNNKKSENNKRRTKNIVLIGTIGAGKSSTVNTTIATFSRECWEPRADAGSYGLRGETRTITKTT